MSFTVGFDFGTHQTKICIEDASNPAQKLYEFLEFENPYEKSSVLFPSVVQINEDDTISYGFVDEEKCKILHCDGSEKPKLRLSQKPLLILPTEPQKPVFPPRPKTHSWKDKIQNLLNLIKQHESLEILSWKEECIKLQNEYEVALNEWKTESDILQEQHQEKFQNWNTEKKKRETEFQYHLEEWRKGIKEKLYYRYFKLSTFYNTVDWSHEIDTDTISIWYIAYILFTLQEKLGEDFFVQMGIPSGTNQTILQKQKNKAYTILISAYQLVEKYGSKEAFLSEKCQTLINVTDLKSSYSEGDVLFYGLNVVPEAYAGLYSITQQKRLETGMSLLVDIGGGTTDIAFFTIRESQPDIHSVLSFPKGLNSIFDNYIQNNKHLAISDVQDIFLEKQGESLLFSSSISQYHNLLLNQVKRLIADITKSFELRKDFHQLSTSKLREALENRPVVFCGGGAIYKSMQTTLMNFTDIKLINRNLINIPFLKNQNLDESLFVILATSYGLSIPVENEIVLTPIEKVFSHIEGPVSDKWNYGYDHGLSDY